MAAEWPSFDPSRVGRDHFQPESGTAFVRPAVLHFMAAGTVTVTDMDGNDLNYDVLQGFTLPILAKKVTIVSTITIDKIRCWC